MQQQTRGQTINTWNVSAERSNLTSCCRLVCLFVLDHKTDSCSLTKTLKIYYWHKTVIQSGSFRGESTICFHVSDLLNSPQKEPTQIERWTTHTHIVSLQRLFGIKWKKVHEQYFVFVSESSKNNKLDLWRTSASLCQLNKVSMNKLIFSSYLTC